MEATVLFLAKSVLDGALSKAKSAVAEAAALQLGVQRELSFIKDEFEMIKTFLTAADEEPSHSHGNKVLKTWVKQVRDLAYDVEDCLQDFTLHSESEERPSCGGCSARTLRARHRIATDLKELKARVEDVSQRNLRYRLIEQPSSTSTSATAEHRVPSSVDAAMLVGIQRRSAKQRHMKNLGLSRVITSGDRDLRVVAVWGTGGDLGKTTIIRASYDDPRVHGRFECRGWVRLTHPFDPKYFFQTLTRQFYERSLPDEPAAKGFDALRKLGALADDQLVDDFEAHVNSRRYLIVVNDLSSIEEWDWIRTYLPDKKNGSRVIVSTQQLELASLCTEQPNQVSELKQLSSDQAIYLFYKKVRGLETPERFSEIELDPRLSRSKDVGSSQIVPPDDREDISVGTGDSLQVIKKFMSVPQQPLTLYWTTPEADWEESQLIGRHREKCEVIQLICHRNECREVISVWGMCGIGKTTLVQSVYGRRDLNGMFQKHAWITVMHPFNSKDIFRSLALQLHEAPTDFSTLGVDIQNKLATMTIEDLIQETIRLLEGHKYLVVLDDILSIEELDLILPFLPEENKSSRIIITTREECVATHSSREYKLKPLQDEPAFDLFKEKVFKEAREIHLNPDMIKEGRSIIKRCARLPLAIATIGGFLATRPKSILEWRNLNVHFSAELYNNPSLEKLKTVLTLSYESLPHNLKPCFLYLFIFPEGHYIRRRRLVKRWIAEDYSRQTRGLTADEAAEKQFMDLINQSMIQPPESEKIASSGSKKINFCQVHDLMREICISKSEEENLVCVLEEQCTMPFKDKPRHLVVRSSWNRDAKKPLEIIMDVSHVRSLTVFGEWRSYFTSKKMRFLRVLDLECASGLQDHDIVPIGELLHLKYLSLRGSLRVFNLPGSFGNLSNLETLDIRHTFVIKLPPTIAKLEKLKYLHAGLVPDDETDSRAEITELFRKCCSAVYKMCTGDSSNVEYGKECLKYLVPLSNIAFDLLLRGLDPYGVRAPRGIGRLMALHTLGVVNIARGNAVLKELKKHTQLRKLGVSGINRKNCKDLCSSITNNSLLCSLSMRAEGELGLEGCLDGLSLPPKELQSLKLYGNLVNLPAWVEQLQNLTKLTLRSTKLKMDATLQVLGMLPSLSILHLCKRSCEDGLLHFHFQHDTFTSLRVLDLENLENIKSIIFEAGATPKLELLLVHHCSHTENFEISGLPSVKSLKDVSLKGSCNSMLKNVLRDQLASNPNKPELKIED